jgi:hypothetical protein
VSHRRCDTKGLRLSDWRAQCNPEGGRGEKFGAK